MGLFKERKTKFLLLSVLSAVVVVSTAFAGVSIYAQSDGSNLTTFEEEAMKDGETFDDSTNKTSTAAADSTDQTTTASAEVQALLKGLVICDLGTAQVSGQTGVASLGNASSTSPTVSVKVMTETQVAELAANQTETASTNNATSNASATCVQIGEANSTSASASNATTTENTTSASINATNAANVTSTANATSTNNITSTSSTLSNSNKTLSSSEIRSDRQILVIEGKDFTPGQAVLIFSTDALLAIDDVDSSGHIEAKVAKFDTGQTNTAANDTSDNTELRFVETGTVRTGTFDFNGQTLTAATSGEIKAEGAGGSNNGTSSATNSSGNQTSTSSSSSMNSANSGSSSAPQY